MTDRTCQNTRKSFTETCGRRAVWHVPAHGRNSVARDFCGHCLRGYYYAVMVGADRVSQNQRHPAAFLARLLGATPITRNGITVGDIVEHTNAPGMGSWYVGDVVGEQIRLNIDGRVSFTEPRPSHLYRVVVPMKRPEN